MRKRSWLALTLSVGVPFVWLPIGEAAAAELQGRAVADVLREATQAGLRIIYSDALVRPQMRVTVEATTTERVQAVREILRPHGLTLEEVATGVFAVTRARRVPPLDATQMSPPSDEVLDEVLIASSRYTIETLRTTPPYSAGSLDLERQPALVDDATRGLRMFPGTAGSPLTGRLFVRGGLAEENLLLLDGVPLHDPFHLSGLPVDFSFIDPEIIDRVDFYAGVQPVEYDERMSSVVDMRTRQPFDHPGGRVSLGFTNASALLGAPLSGPGDWLVFARRSLLDQAARIAGSDLGRPVLFDAYGRFQHQLSDDALVAVGMLLADDSMRLAEAAGTESISSEADRQYVWATLHKQWGAVTSRTVLTHHAGRLERNGQLSEPGYGVGSVHDARQIRSTLLRQDWTLPFEPEGAWHWGAAIRHESGELDYARHVAFSETIAALFGTERRDDLAVGADATLREYEAWLGARRGFGERWALEGGAHWSLVDHSTGNRASRLDPRVTALYRLSPATRLRASWGRMRQRWSATELPVELGAVRFGEPARSTMWVVGAEHDFAAALSVRLEAFEKRVDHPRARRENLLDTLVLLPELRADAVAVSPERVRVNGIDLHIVAEGSDRLKGWLSYSWSNARDLVNGLAVARSWDQRHSLAVGLTFDYRAWQFSGMLTARSDWPQTPVLVSADDPGIQVGTRNSEREQLFLTLDLKAERRIPLARGTLSLVLEVLNATNERNACCRELMFESGTEEIRAGVEEDYWPQLVPLASVAWEF